MANDLLVQMAYCSAGSRTWDKKVGDGLQENFFGPLGLSFV